MLISGGRHFWSTKLSINESLNRTHRLKSPGNTGVGDRVGLKELSTTRLKSKPQENHFLSSVLYPPNSRRGGGLDCVLYKRTMCRNLTTRGLDSDNLKIILLKKQLCNRLKINLWQSALNGWKLNTIQYKI